MNYHRYLIERETRRDLVPRSYQRERYRRETWPRCQDERTDDGIARCIFDLQDKRTHARDKSVKSLASEHRNVFNKSYGDKAIRERAGY